jgi:hypothetical protein
MAFIPEQARGVSYLSGPWSPHYIKVTVAQSGNADHFSIVEESILNQGIWSRTDDSNFTLTITGTDVSGVLRFKGSGDFEHTFILVVVGIDHSVPWLDLKVTTNASETGASILQGYYNSNNQESVTKSDHKTSASIPFAPSHNVTVQYYTPDQERKHGAERRGVILTIT